MEQEEIKWYNHGWTIALVSAILAPLATFVFDVIRKIPIFSTLKHWLTIQIDLWILLSVIILFTVYAFLTSRKKRINYQNVSSLKYDDDFDNAAVGKMMKEENILNHTAQKFDELVWKWEWRKNPLIDRYEVKNALPVCPNEVCNFHNLDLTGYNEEFGGYDYNCSSCGDEYFSHDQPREIAKEIEAKYYP